MNKNADNSFDDQLLSASGNHTDVLNDAQPNTFGVNRPSAARKCHNEEKEEILLLFTNRLYNKFDTTTTTAI